MRGYGARNTRPLPGCPRPEVAGARRREFLTHRPGGRLTVAGPRRNLTGLPPLPSRVAASSDHGHPAAVTRGRGLPRIGARASARALRRRPGRGRRHRRRRLGRPLAGGPPVDRGRRGAARQRAAAGPGAGLGGRRAGALAPAAGPGAARPARGAPRPPRRRPGQRGPDVLRHRDVAGARARARGRAGRPAPLVGDAGLRPDGLVGGGDRRRPRGRPPRRAGGPARHPGSPAAGARLGRHVARGAGRPPHRVGLRRQPGHRARPSWVAPASGGSPAPRPPGRTPETDPLVLTAVEVVADPGTVPLPTTPGLPDDAYEHDGQLTKRDVRAVTLARLAPAARPAAVGRRGRVAGRSASSGCAPHPSCRAVAVESAPDRAARIARNAARLGVPDLQVVEGRAPEALAGLPAPDAVFVGGGATVPGVLDACWDALPSGGRLVVNAVTLESEAVLAERHARHGGELVRLGVAHAVPVGGFSGWKPAMPVTIWSGDADDRALHRRGPGRRRPDHAAGGADHRGRARLPVRGRPGAARAARTPPRPAPGWSTPPTWTWTRSPPSWSPRTRPATTSPGCTPATRRSTARWPSRCAASTRPACPTTSSPACPRSPRPPPRSSAS